MNEHPLRDDLRRLLRTPEKLSAEEVRRVTEHLEACAVCLETVEELLRDPVMERCRGMLRRVEECQRDGSTVAPTASMPEQNQVEPPIRFPGPPTAEGPLGTLGRYAIAKKVGEGTFGLVFRALDQRLGRTVAVKVLRPQYAPHQSSRARFENEARAMASIQLFDHVVQVHEVDAAEVGDFTYPYLVMEWVEGPTLKDQMDGPMPWREAVRIAREVAQGLTAIHQRITAHRDLKPSNIMLVGEAQRAKIMDFGLALPADLSAEERMTQHGDFVGTPAYASPEQARGADVLDGRSDVFSLGVVLYEMLAGQLPFAGKNKLELLKAIAADEVEPPALRRLNRAVPRDLETIVRKCLAKNAAERYATARALADDLRRLENGQPIAARPAPVWEQAWKWARRHKAAAALAAIIFLGPLCAAAAGWHVGLRETELRQQADWAREQADQLRGDAERERDRARELEHAERVQRARALANRAQWPEARSAYDQAIADDRADADPLRVERLRCLFTFEERPNLQGEFDRLARKDLRPADAALVLLHRADYLMSEWERQKDQVDLVAQALAAPGGLSPADRAYAEGLAASTSDGAVESYRKALAIDPFHHRANSALLTAFLFLGRFEEARRRAEFMRQTFRDDPLPTFASAWIALLEGDRAACFRHLEPMDKVVGAKRARELRAFFDLVGDLLEIGDQLDVQDPAALAMPMIRAGLKIASLSTVSHKALEPFGFGVPTVNRLTASLEAMRLSLLEMMWDGDAAASVRLEAANRSHPDAMLLFLQALCELKQAARREKKDHKAAVILVQTARDRFYRAADAPTILPRASWRYQARLIALALENALAQEPSAADPTRPVRMRQQSDRVAEEGWRMPKARLKFLPAVLEKKMLDPDCARFLAAAWLREEPDSLMPLRHCARLELAAGAWSVALHHADRILRDQPKDMEMQKLRNDALAGLRKQLDGQGD